MLASLLMSAGFSQVANKADLRHFSVLRPVSSRWPDSLHTLASPRLPAVRPVAGMLPATFYVQHLAPTCRAEWKLQKATGLALRLRLGSLQYSNYLEGK